MCILNEYCKCQKKSCYYSFTKKKKKKKSAHYITHSAMHCPEVYKSQVDFFNFLRIHHNFENHTNIKGTLDAIELSMCFKLFWQFSHNVLQTIFMSSFLCENYSNCIFHCRILICYNCT